MWFSVRLSTSLLSLAILSAIHAQTTTTLPSGLQIEAVSGPTACSRPTKNGDRISVHYRGSLLTTGKEFDASYNRGTPFTFTLGAQQVIQGWDDGLVDMCIGASRKLTIPPELGYGDRGAGRDIPPKSTLVFETTLMAIAGVEAEDLLSATSTSASTGEGAFAIATAPPTPSPTIAVEVVDDKIIVTPVESSADDSNSAPVSTTDKDGDEKPQRCSLVGPFALLVQGALGGLALLTLVWKRWREHPKRPLKVFVFDVSKQVLGSMLTHVINLAMSMLSSVDMANAAAHAVSKVGEQAKEKYGTPNPCSFYLLNLAIDTTLGVPVLYLLLIVLTAAFMHTPLARPPQSLKSGNYGVPPKAAWYGKQLMIYCIGLVGMKLFVFFLFVVLPWLPWIGDWALRWTRGNEQLEIAFALFIFPLMMNAVQYWVIDNLIMDKQKGDTGEGAAYQQVDDDERDADHRQFGLEDDEDDGDEDDTLVGHQPAATAPSTKAADAEFGPDFVDQTAEAVLKKDRSAAADHPT